MFSLWVGFKMLFAWDGEKYRGNKHGQNRNKCEKYIREDLRLCSTPFVESHKDGRESYFPIMVDSAMK